MKRLFILTLSLIFLLAIVTGVWFLYVSKYSQESAGEPVTITVASQDHASSIAKQLQKSGLISWAFEYEWYAQTHQLADHPKEGEYVFRHGASLLRIATVLSKGPQRSERSVRLVEGKSLDENIEALSLSGIDTAPYTALVGRSLNVHPFDHALIQKYSFLSVIPDGQSLEGYLFPDTYHMFEDDPASLVSKQLDQFEKVVMTRENMDAQQKSGMSWHEVMTLASIVQDEVRGVDEMKIVAGIFLNRLKIHMALQSDATVNYVLHHGKARSSAEDIQVDSPYNTYKYPGLPPGPISNPGSAAIEAVLNPQASDDLYFLTDEAGKLYTAKTLDEHVQNKQKAFGN